VDTDVFPHSGTALCDPIERLSNQYLGGKMSQAAGKPVRLLLMALLLASPYSAFPEQSSSPAQQWRQSPKTDSASGIAYSQFTLGGKFVKWPEKDASNRPTLEVDCKDEGRSGGSKGTFWRAYLLAGTPLAIKYVEPDQITAGVSYYPKIAVRYRLNAEKEKAEQWSPGADKSSASIPKETLKRMIEAHTVVISLNENGGAEVSGQFEIPDSSEVGKACDMGLRKK
jgi:hypothetical protein